MKMTWKNPVWRDEFADPFVLKVGRDYYAYGTAPRDPLEPQFPVLHSKDLASWRYVDHALKPLMDPPAFVYWAPEVAQRQGRFYLYYSATTSESDEHHRLRVAVADKPEGPFVDAGKLLLPESGFTIDAHPFHDPVTRKWYLFFARDYTADKPTGTGLAVVELADDMIHARGEPEPVLRAACSWQIYERNREYKGQVWPAWHCIEGPFVVYHDRRYWCLYSGGAWHAENYGVSCAVADSPMGPWHDPHSGEGPTVLRGKPDAVVGPGHNSVVLGPDNETLFMVYHAWDAAKTARRMCIDPITWTTTGPVCDGPTTTRRTWPPGK